MRDSLKQVRAFTIQYVSTTIHSDAKITIKHRPSEGDSGFIQ